MRVLRSVFVPLISLRLVELRGLVLGPLLLLVATAMCRSVVVGWSVLY